MAEPVGYISITKSGKGAMIKIFAGEDRKEQVYFCYKDHLAGTLVGDNKFTVLIKNGTRQGEPTAEKEKTASVSKLREAMKKQ